MTGTIRRQQLMGMWWGKRTVTEKNEGESQVENEISPQGAERSTTVLSTKPREV
jgi:hypothetical protein